MKVWSTYRWPFVSALVFSISCGPRAIRSTDEVLGVYTYTFPTGQVEVLCLNADLSYYQEFYAESAAYQLRTDPLFRNDGTWQVHDKNGVTLNAALGFCKNMDARKILANPIKFNALRLPWFAANRHQNAFLLLNDDSGYALVRVTEP